MATTKTGASTVTKGTAQIKKAPVRARTVGLGERNGAAVEVKTKLVRDSFTIPKGEYLVLASLKERAAHLRRPTKKSELLRAGVAALAAMSDRVFLAALAKVPSLKTGRPKDA